MRLILDTNVLLSALLSAHGPPARLLERLGPGTVERLAKGLQEFSIYFRELPAGPIAPDAKDSFLLALAEAAQADFLVTGDKALLALNRHRSTWIVTPAAMIARLPGEAGQTA